jgi:DNA-binding GntR family transcriptional regulator
LAIWGDMRNNSLRQQAYHFIQSKILSGALPAGSRISEQALADELGISRTPVRSAIRELETEGLVEQVARFGTIVRKAERRDLADIYELRVALEGFAAEEAARRIAVDDLAVLQCLCDRMWSEAQRLPYRPEGTLDNETLSRFVAADMQFHMVIVRATGNRRIMKCVSDSRLLGHWGHGIPHTAEMIAGFWGDHTRICEALRRADGEGARRAMTQHIRSAQKGALSVFDRMQARGDADEAMRWTAAPSVVD